MASPLSLRQHLDRLLPVLDHLTVRTPSRQCKFRVPAPYNDTAMLSHARLLLSASEHDRRLWRTLAEPGQEFFSEVLLRKHSGINHRWCRLQPLRQTEFHGLRWLLVRHPQTSVTVGKIDAIVYTADNAGVSPNIFGADLDCPIALHIQKLSAEDIIGLKQAIAA